MKPIRAFLLLAIPALLVSCDRNEEPAAAAPVSPAPVFEEPVEAAPTVVVEDPSAAPEEPLYPIDEDPVVLEESTPGQKLDHAIERTEEGLRRALEATGRGLQRAGEKIEEKAGGQ